MATKSIAWDSGGGYITLTYTGSGDGNITAESDENTLGTSRSKTITVQTVGGAVTRNLTISQAACPFPVGEVRNYGYTGSYQEVELPAGKYKLQCWGAQGGSNGTNSSYGITAQAGGKGGYSEGVITLSSKTTVRVYVGGQGSASAGGFNGGGSTTGTSQYNSGDTFGYSKMGGGGGATDIRLSDGALLSRMIVAGGGSGGAMCYKQWTTTETQTETILSEDITSSSWVQTQYTSLYGGARWFNYGDLTPGGWYILDTTCNYRYFQISYFNGDVEVQTYNIPAGQQYQIGGGGDYTRFAIVIYTDTQAQYSGDFTVQQEVEVTVTHEDWDSQTGYAGGGTNGAGYSSTYQGRQNAAGGGGSFGQGANQTTTNYRYCSGAGGGGWYGGGGGQKSDSTMTYCRYSGGGSGWVNTSASADNRPSGYTGLELDSGTTYAGNTSFPSTGGGTETGHSGNGYARITRLN